MYLQFPCFLDRKRFIYFDRSDIYVGNVLAQASLHLFKCMCLASAALQASFLIFPPISISYHSVVPHSFHTFSVSFFSYPLINPVNVDFDSPISCRKRRRGWLGFASQNPTGQIPTPRHRYQIGTFGVDICFSRPVVRSQRLWNTVNGFKIFLSDYSSFNTLRSISIQPLKHPLIWYLGPVGLLPSHLNLL